MLAVSGGRIVLLSTPFGNRDFSAKNGAKAARIGARSRSRRATGRVFIVNGLMLSVRPFEWIR
jgi:hypothetical protein